MSNQLSQLLGQWHPLRDVTEWVLGTVYKTEGPCYRKAGAMMLFNGVGQQYGLLSGGCLESDIQAHAKRVMQTGQATVLCYDGSDEDDVSFQLGIGCGGTVHILLQLINQSNDYLYLDIMLAALRQRRSGKYYQRIPDEISMSALPTQCWYEELGKPGDNSADGVRQEGDDSWFVNSIEPEPHILIVGGGLDARPVVSIAKELGWMATLCDPRPANARAEVFAGASNILRSLDESLINYCLEQRVDAVVIMTHNVAMDAQALRILQGISALKYMALLGPISRKVEVLNVAQIDEGVLPVTLSSPAGFDIGGELPESIALSILAECHKAIFNPC